MTKFNGKLASRSLEEWEDVAIDAVESDGHSPQGLVVLGLAAGAAVATLSPLAPLGLLPIALALKKAMDINARRSRMEAAIASGAYASVLPMADLREYSHQFGLEETMEQIEWAHLNGVPLSEAAQTLRARYRQKMLAAAPPDSATPSEGATPSESAATTVEVEAVPVDQAVKQGQTGTNAPTPLPATAKDLLERLKAECPTLLKLIKSPPIRLVGAQRTGKSTFARVLLLLRLLFLAGHKAAYATPHIEADNPVHAQLNPFGHSADGKDYRTIERFWAGVQKAIDGGKQLSLSIVWDEFGSYDEFENGDLLGKSLRSLLRESSKHGYFPILVAHGDQASFYPGVENILTTLQKSTVKVETLGEARGDFGEMVPTGRALMTWLDGLVEELTLPSWLTVDFLLSLLPAVTPAPGVVTDEAETAPSSEQNESEEAGENYQTQEAESTKEEEAIARVRTSLIAKIGEANDEWVSVSKLVQCFRSDDRQIVKRLIEKSVFSGILQHEIRDNHNGTRSFFVRLVPRN
ncbi:hypothetical protein [Leptolyngbya sp. FACHB-16]|uniref:hypothetical protein n=1 Tax=unclassified Leptolyngbya TaxID=2650499 RepID=UPI001685B001|nr:hypothetical protein [Leptolyngbya sp. FACHB-16]MBD2156026.1 hypothetical protein [Leptolyngbya sp. FACHB-16]